MSNPIRVPASDWQSCFVVTKHNWLKKYVRTSIFVDAPLPRSGD
jgi:hypothetical protein